MSTQHTPGPWVGKNAYRKYNSDHTWSVDDEDAQSCEFAPIWADGRVIALVVHSSNTFSAKSHPSIDANARLIAAAPDLLAELRKARTALQESLGSLIESHTDPTTGLINDGADLLAIESEQDLINSIDAAIAKATEHS